MIAFVLAFGFLGLVAGSSYPVTYLENTTTKRPTRPWETRPWAYSTKAWNRGFSTRNRSYPTHLPTQPWGPYTNHGHNQGQIVRFPDGQIVQYGRNTGAYGPHMQTPVIHYNQGTVPTQSWKNMRKWLILVAIRIWYT